MLQLPSDARTFAILVLWFYVAFLGELVTQFVFDPEHLVHPPGNT